MSDSETAVSRCAKVADICQSIDYGYTASAAAFRGGARFLRITDLQDGKVDWQSVPGCEICESEEASVALHDGDIVFARTGATTGKSFLIRTPPRAIFASYLIRMRLDQARVLPQYLHHFFQSDLYWGQLRRFARGAAQPSVNASLLGLIRVPLPPLAEQVRIAAMLTEQLAVVERARGAVEARLAAAEMLPGAYLREVFEGPGANKWKKVRMGDVCKVVEGQVDPRDPQYGSLPHVNGENIESGTGRLLEVRTAAQDGLISGKYLFEPGMVLYSKLRPYLRKIALAPFRGVCSADMYPLIFDPQQVASEFAVWALLAEPFTRFAVEESERARMPKLNREQLFRYTLALPATVADQHRIAADLSRRLAEAERLIARVQQELAAIEALPAALLREAFAPSSPSGEGLGDG